MTNFQLKFPPILYYLTAIFLVMLLFGLTGVLKPIRRFAEKLLVLPVRQKIYDTGRFFKKDLNGCEVKNEREVSELKAKIVSLEEENKEQRRLLSLPLPKNWKFIEAKVIGVENESLTLNIGAGEEVKEGMTVLLGNTYLGKIFKVSEKIASARLPSFLDEKESVSIFSEKEKSVVGRGLLVGWGEGRMKVGQIFLTENVTKDNLVKISIDGGELLVGSVSEVVEKRGEMFKSASVKRLYNPEELNTVFVVKGKI